MRQRCIDCRRISFSISALLPYALTWRVPLLVDDRTGSICLRSCSEMQRGEYSTIGNKVPTKDFRNKDTRRASGKATTLSRVLHGFKTGKAYRRQKTDTEIPYHGHLCLTSSPQHPSPGKEVGLMAAAIAPE
ncbi:hypothetical protein BC628DRAFT_1384857 [Trametes gibbosa]|nr:hypothetical protein BC628DRAFT_1384857 [Trametes gibbosa]